jgi:hypothetical protein
MKNVSDLFSAPVKMTGILAIVVMASCSAPRQAFLTTPDSRLLTQVSAEEAEITGQAAAGTVTPDFLASTDEQALAPVAEQPELTAALEELSAKNPKAAAKLTQALAEAQNASPATVQATKKQPLLASMMAKKAAKKAEKLSKKDPNDLKAQKAPQRNGALISVGAIIALAGLILLLLQVQPAIATVALIVGAIILLIGLI